MHEFIDDQEFEAIIQQYSPLFGWQLDGNAIASLRDAFPSKIRIDIFAKTMDVAVGDNIRRPAELVTAYKREAFQSIQGQSAPKLPAAESDSSLPDGAYRLFRLLRLLRSGEYKCTCKDRVDALPNYGQRRDRSSWCPCFTHMWDAELSEVDRMPKLSASGAIAHAVSSMSSELSWEDT